jgi:hypothetical protein
MTQTVTHRVVTPWWARLLIRGAERVIEFCERFRRLERLD